MIYSLSNMSSVVDIAQNVGRIFDESLACFAKDPAWEGRSGAYFTFADPKWGIPQCVLLVGDLQEDREKAQKYLRNATEKCFRLAGYPQHLSSWQSRNPDQNSWGGAVRGNYIYSMSGLPELGDEAVMMNLILQLQPDSTSKSLMEAAAFISNNPYYVPLREFLNRRE